MSSLPSSACRTCRHPKRARIDAALLGGESIRAVMGRYGLSMGSVARHRRDHLAASRAEVLVGVEREAGVREPADLVPEACRLLDSARSVLQAATDDDDQRMALAANREARGALELVAKLLGELDERPTTNVLVTSPEWIEVQGRVLRALEPYPEARAAVAASLRGGEAERNGAQPHQVIEG